MSADPISVTTGGRLHVGFRNLSAERERLFGSIGVGVSEPRTRVAVRPATDVETDHDRARRFGERAVSLLDVEGAAITIEEELPRHVGLGSGTQLALAIYTGIAIAHGRQPDVRRHAPALGRGRRSGVGIATFEAGGFVVDSGHPTDRVLDASHLTAGAWQTPEIEHRLGVPESWRFVLVLPDAPPGTHHEEEARSIRSAIDAADAAPAAEIEEILKEQLLPALREDDIVTFGRGITRIDAVNGAWFEAVQSATYRPLAGPIVDTLAADEAILGVGQSSWGALVYGLTAADRAEEARAAGQRALEVASSTGRVWLVSARNHGATVIDSDKRKRDMDGSLRGEPNE